MTGWTARLLLTAIILVTAPSLHAKDADAEESGFENRLRRAIAVQGEPADQLPLPERMAYYNVPGLSLAIIEGCEVFKHAASA